MVYTFFNVFLMKQALGERRIRKVFKIPKTNEILSNQNHIFSFFSIAKFVSLMHNKVMYKGMYTASMCKYSIFKREKND